MKRRFRRALKNFQRREERLENRMKRNVEITSLLPKNEELEAAAAYLIVTRQDPRASLEFIRRLVKSTVLSLAAPVGPWDPYDVKPQVFAFGRGVGLPIFSSLPYLRTFCARHRLTVKDPFGRAWAGPVDDAVPLPRNPTTNLGLASVIDAAARVEKLEYDSVVPLATHGPPIRPFLVGYFCDLQTFVDNAKIVSSRVDVVLNPSTALELAIARETATSALSESGLVQAAMREVERELRREFFLMLSTCSEVVRAGSCALPLPAPSETPTNDWPMELVIVIDSEDYEQTMRSIARGKAAGALIGHSELRLLSVSVAPPHIMEIASWFYVRKESDGAYRDVGGCTIGTRASPDNYYHDPTAQYSEAHTVFLDRLSTPYHSTH